LEKLNEELAVAIGFFDGVHLGHQAVIKKAVKYAKKNNLISVVMTFDRSPKFVLGKVKADSNLTTDDEKFALLEEMDVDYVLVLEFDDELLRMSAQDFIDEYLIRTKARFVSVGFDFRFGYRGLGDCNVLLNHGGFAVEITEPVMIGGLKVSTTEIKKYRNEKKNGKIEEMLGRTL